MYDQKEKEALEHDADMIQDGAEKIDQVVEGGLYYPDEE